MLSSNEITTFTGEWPSEIVNCFQSIKTYYVLVKKKKKEKNPACPIGTKRHRLTFSCLLHLGRMSGVLDFEEDPVRAS